MKCVLFLGSIFLSSLALARLPSDTVPVQSNCNQQVAINSSVYLMYCMQGCASSGGDYGFCVNKCQGLMQRMKIQPSLGEMAPIKSCGGKTSANLVSCLTDLLEKKMEAQASLAESPIKESKSGSQSAR